MDRTGADSAVLLTLRPSRISACALRQQVQVSKKEKNSYQHGDAGAEPEGLILDS